MQTELPNQPSPAASDPLWEKMSPLLDEALAALGETDAALQVWQQVTAEHSYARAKVQLAELCLAQNQPELARTELKDVISDDVHGPTFQRKRDRVWVWRAKILMRKL